MKYSEWLEIWLEDYVKPSVKARTYVHYRLIVEKRLIPRFGNYALQDITPAAVQKYVAELSQNGNSTSGVGLSANTVNGIVTVIQSSLKLACLFGETERYTADKVRRPRVKEKQITCFSISEQKKIENAVLSGGKTKLFGVVVCLYTGLRIGELLALTWQDVDFSAGILYVNRTCYDAKDADGKFRRFTGEPKTALSKRAIPVPKKLLVLLKERKKTRASAFVAGYEDGMVSVRTYQRNFERLLKKLRIPRKGFHSLRHTFATRALECGMNVKTLSEILGHKNAAITLNRYVHSTPDYKKEMMNKLGKLL